jgi:hypothetical protein
MRRVSRSVFFYTCVKVGLFDTSRFLLTFLTSFATCTEWARVQIAARTRKPGRANPTPAAGTCRRRAQASRIRHGRARPVRHDRRQTFTSNAAAAPQSASLCNKRGAFAGSACTRQLVLRVRKQAKARCAHGGAAKGFVPLG